MKITLFRAACVLALATAGLEVACSGSTSSGNGGSGNAANDYCNELSSYVTKCNITDPCSVATVQNCTKYVSGFSAAALNDISACAAGATCGDAGSAAVTACISSKQAGHLPSTAQTKLAQDYCNVCASSASQTVTACVTGFYATGGTGTFFLDLNDTIVASADTQCTPKLTPDAGQFGCIGSFGFCAEPIVAAALYTPPQCTATPNPGSQSDGG